MTFWAGDGYFFFLGNVRHMWSPLSIVFLFPFVTSFVRFPNGDYPQNKHHINKCSFDHWILMIPFAWTDPDEVTGGPSCFIHMFLLVIRFGARLWAVGNFTCCYPTNYLTLVLPWLISICNSQQKPPTIWPMIINTHQYPLSSTPFFVVKITRFCRSIDLMPTLDW